MKFFLLSAVCCLALSGVSAQSGVLKTIGGAAKSKAEQQDFNSTRGNKEKGMLREENKKRSSPAPGASAPESAAPADTTQPAEPVTPAPAAEPVTPSLIRHAKYNDAYSFAQKITYASDDAKGDDRDTVTYRYTDGAILTIVDDQETSIIMDFANEAMISFDEKRKTAMVMGSRWATKMAERQAEKNDDVTITKTGETKQILGYNCEEYIIQGKTKSVCWVTSEIKLDYAKTMMAVSRNSPNAKADGFSSQGLMMEMTGFSKKGEANFHMIITEFKEEAFVKALSGYTVTAL